MEPRLRTSPFGFGGNGMTDLPMHPEPPSSPPDPGLVVLGRFQPVHRGHALMMAAAEEWRLLNTPELRLIIAIGSSNRPESIGNPWSAEEREAMLGAWLADKDGFEDVLIVAIPDIDDPPNWVTHAEKYHGSAGIFFTSDLPSADLYETGGWQAVRIPLEQRERFEGWRVRATAQMMSTIDDDDAVRAVLSPAVPTAVVEHLIETQGLRRLAFLGEGGEPVG